MQLGRCYLASGQSPAAEECFLAAIEVDPDSIDCRIELANMYEKAREEEEALILAAEAMALREAQDGTGRRGGVQPAPRRRSETGPHVQRRVAIRSHGESDTSHPTRPMIPRRYRPRRLGAPEQRRREEQAHAVKLSHQYEAVRELKQLIQAGRTDLIDSWVNSSRELVDDFRSLKKFYSWDKYLQFLGSQSAFSQRPQEPAENELFQMYERLTQSKGDFQSQSQSRSESTDKLQR